MVAEPSSKIGAGVGGGQRLADGVFIGEQARHGSERAIRQHCADVLVGDAGSAQLGDHRSYRVALVLMRQFAAVHDHVVAGEVSPVGVRAALTCNILLP